MILRNGTLVDPVNGREGVGDLRVADGKIADVRFGETIAPNAGEVVVDCAGKIVAPGLVDMHVHLRVPGQEYKEDLESGLKAAAAGGFTSVACMPNTKPVIDNAPIVRDLYAQARQVSGAKLSVIGALSKGMENRELAEMADLREAGVVAVSDDAFQVQDSEFLRRAMEYARMLNLPVLTHCEDISLTEGGTMNEGYTASVLGLKGLPAEAYEMHVARNCLLSLLTGATLHILHVSTAREVDILRYFKGIGAKVTAETAPHYWCLTDEACRGYNTNAKMNPPLRTEKDINGIIAGLKEGTLDAIATDHAPHAGYEKAQEFALAPFGIVGLETSLALGVTHLVRPGHLTWMQWVERMSVAPRRILRIPGGNLNIGGAADITVIDPEVAWTVDPDRFLSKSHNTPFAGQTLFGQATLVLVDGNPVFHAIES